MSVKESVPLSDNICVDALVSSVNPKSPIALVILGTSFVPVIVIATSSVSVAPLVSVIVTLYVNLIV